MRYVTCSLCQADQIPQNSALRVDNALYCENCLKETFPDDASLKGKQVFREYDPTVCFNCAQDFGERPLEKLGSYPVCRDCDDAIKQKVFPTWVKAFFMGVLVLVVFFLCLELAIYTRPFPVEGVG